MMSKQSKISNALFGDPLLFRALEGYDMGVEHLGLAVPQHEYYSVLTTTAITWKTIVRRNLWYFQGIGKVLAKVAPVVRTPSNALFAPVAKWEVSSPVGSHFCLTRSACRSSPHSSNCFIESRFVIIFSPLRPVAFLLFLSYSFIFNTVYFLSSNTLPSKILNFAFAIVTWSYEHLFLLIRLVQLCL